MSEIDDLIAGLPGALQAYYAANFVPESVPLGAIYGLDDIESAQLVFDALPGDRAGLIKKFGIEVLAARPMIAAQRHRPH